MPLPFLLIPIGIYGAKKVYDAYEDNSTANHYNEEAKKIYDKAQDDLNSIGKDTNLKIEELKILKLKMYKKSLNDFVCIFSLIKNVDFEDKLDLGTEISIDSKNIMEFKNDVLKFIELYTASTISGVGITLGASVLGGIVAAPILAVAGGIFAAKAETAKHEAYANYDKAKAYVEEMKIEQVKVEEIKGRVVEFINILKSLESIFEDYLDKLENIVYKNKDYLTYTKGEKEIVRATAEIAFTVKNICDTPIIDENGDIARKSKLALINAKEFIKKLEEI